MATIKFHSGPVRKFDADGNVTHETCCRCDVLVELFIPNHTLDFGVCEPCWVEDGYELYTIEQFIEDHRANQDLTVTDPPF